MVRYVDPLLHKFALTISLFQAWKKKIHLPHVVHWALTCWIENEAAHTQSANPVTSRVTRLKNRHFDNKGRRNKGFGAIKRK